MELTVYWKKTDNWQVKQGKNKTTFESDRCYEENKEKKWRK